MNYILVVWCMFLSVISYAIEKPKYEIIKKINKIEIRKYEKKLVAQVSIPNSDFDKAGSIGFKKLAKFIFGENTVINNSSQKISMTAPVEFEKSKKIPMTAPVEMGSVTKNNPDNYIMRFVMPKKYTKKSLPKPNNKEINIFYESAKCQAALKYSGSWGQEKYKKNEKKLLEILKNNQIKSIGEPIFARYNSPLMIWFLRRNEVLIDIDLKHCSKKIKTQD